VQGWTHAPIGEEELASDERQEVRKWM
jgi:hypothetical protein